MEGSPAVFRRSAGRLDQCCHGDNFVIRPLPELINIVIQNADEETEAWTTGAGERRNSRQGLATARSAMDGRRSVAQAAERQTDKAGSR
jgi:hypothetical protein